MLYEKRQPTTLTTTAPTGSAVASAEADISNDHTVRVGALYAADGAAKALRIYPEVKISGAWVPALSAAIDTSGATVDAEGYVAATVAPPYLLLDGISGTSVAVCVDIPVPAGDRFRVRVLESGYDAGHPATLTVLAVPSRGAT